MLGKRLAGLGAGILNPSPLDVAQNSVIVESTQTVAQRLIIQEKAIAENCSTLDGWCSEREEMGLGCEIWVVGTGKQRLRLLFIASRLVFFLAAQGSLNCTYSGRDRCWGQH